MHPMWSNPVWWRSLWVGVTVAVQPSPFCLLLALLSHYCVLISTLSSGRGMLLSCMAGSSSSEELRMKYWSFFLKHFFVLVNILRPLYFKLMIQNWSTNVQRIVKTIPQPTIERGLQSSDKHGTVSSVKPWKAQVGWDDQADRVVLFSLKDISFLKRF